MPAGKMTKVYSGKGYYGKTPKIHRYRKVYRKTINTDKALNPRFAGASNTKEYKFHDTPTAATPSVSGVAFSPLGQIPCGITSEDRIGNKINVKSFQQRGIMTIDPATLTGYVHIRQLVVLDKQPNHLTFAPPANILEPGVNPLTAPLNSEFFSRFIVLKDRIHTLDTEQYRSKTFSFYKKFNMEVTYQSDATDVPETNNILTFWFSNEPAVTGKLPNIIATDRTRYVDN